MFRFQSLCVLLIVIFFNTHEAFAQIFKKDTLKNKEVVNLVGSDSLEKDNPELLASPNSVQGQIKEDKKLRESKLFQKGDDFLDKNLGLRLGSDYNVTLQQISNSSGPSDAAGGVFRVHGKWDLLRKFHLFKGGFIVKVENRQSLGTMLSPKQLGESVGYSGYTSASFNNSGWLVSNFYWSQVLLNKIAFNIGFIDVSDNTNVNGIGNVWIEFNNAAFSLEPTLPYPNQGLGSYVFWQYIPKFYIAAGMSDANGNKNQYSNVFTSFYEDREYFKNVELGHFSSLAKRNKNNVHITLWQVDERKSAHVPYGQGIAFSWNKEFTERWNGFLRAGWGEGGGVTLEKSITSGIRYQFSQRNDFLGVGVNWGQAPQKDSIDIPKDQWAIEMYYRTQFFPQVMISPSVQFIINPAYNTENTNLWLMGLRLRTAF